MDLMIIDNKTQLTPEWDHILKEYAKSFGSLTRIYNNFPKWMDKVLTFTPNRKIYIYYYLKYITLLKSTKVIASIGISKIKDNKLKICHIYTMPKSKGHDYGYSLFSKIIECHPNVKAVYCTSPIGNKSFLKNFNLIDLFYINKRELLFWQNRNNIHGLHRSHLRKKE